MKFLGTLYYKENSSFRNLRKTIRELKDYVFELLSVDGAVFRENIILCFCLTTNFNEIKPF